MDTSPALLPERILLPGRLVILEPINPEVHGEALWHELSGKENDPFWEYLPDGPFTERAAFNAYLSRKANSTDAVCYAIVGKDLGLALGIATLMRIDRPNRVVEVGGIHYSTALQRT